LSVSRTFGDIEAKREKFGGNPNVVIATPEIKEFIIDDKMDFLLLGCDGIFDKISNAEVIKQSWIAAKKNFHQKDQPIHQICGYVVE
jgi:protein phosphatase PTC2/3